MGSPRYLDPSLPNADAYQVLLQPNAYGTLQSQDDKIASLLYWLGYTPIRNSFDYVPTIESRKPLLQLGNMYYKGREGDPDQMRRSLESVLGPLNLDKEGPRMLVSSLKQKEGLENNSQMRWLDYLPAMGGAYNQQQAAPPNEQDQAQQIAQLLQAIQLYSRAGMGNVR